jgi:hypothetical protein
MAYTTCKEIAQKWANEFFDNPPKAGCMAGWLEERLKEVCPRHFQPEEHTEDQDDKWLILHYMDRHDVADGLEEEFMQS